MKALTVAKKNLTRLFRKRVSILTMVIGPMVLVLLVGLAFSGTGDFAATVGVFSKEYSPLTESLLGKLSERGFTIEKQPLFEACIDSVKRRITNICVVFPDRIREPGATIEFFADYSEVGLVYPILESISSTIDAKADEIAEEITGDILAKLSSAEEEIDLRVPIIVKLFTQSDRLRVQSEHIIESLNDIDLSVNLAQMRSEEVAQQFRMLHGITVATILDANDLIIRLEENLGRLEIADEEIDGALHGAAVDFEKHRRDLEETQADINLLMGSVEGVVGTAAAKLSDAKIAKKSAAKSSADIRDTLANTLDDLNTLQASLASIKDSVTSIEMRDAATIINPIDTRITPITDKKTHFNYLFPTLVMIILMVTGVLLGATMVVEEKSSSEFFRSAISPTRESTILLGILIAAFTVVSVQTFIFLAVASLFFDVALFSSFPATLLSLAAASVLFITIGIFIGAAFRDREAATLSAIILSVLLLLFSGVLLPIEGMTEVMRAIALFNPLVIGQRLLAQSILFGFGLADVSWTLLKITLASVLIFIAASQLSVSLRTRTLARIKYENVEELRSKWNAHFEVWLERVEPALAQFTPSRLLELFGVWRKKRAPTPAYFGDANEDDVSEFRVSSIAEMALLEETQDSNDDPRCKKIDSEICRLQKELEKLD